MSIIDAFHPDSEAVINPSDSVKPVPGFPETLIAIFSMKFLEILSSMTALTEIAVLKAGGREVPVWKFAYNGMELGVYHTLLGGVGSGTILENAIASGCKQVLFLGTCGVLDKELVGGSLIVPTAAYRDEGMSYHYAPPGDYIEVATADRLAAALDELGAPYVKTRTWTTDACYRETREAMQARKAEGCATVEMECASIMAIGQFRKIDVYQLLFATDCLDAAKWDRRIHGNMPNDMRARILITALDALRIILGEAHG